MTEHSHKWKNRIRLIVILLFVVLALVLMFQNTDSVMTRFLFAKLTMPLAALLFITLLIGTGIGFALALWMRRSMRRESGTNSGDDIAV